MKTKPHALGFRQWFARIGAVLVMLGFSGCPFVDVLFDFAINPPAIVGLARTVAIDAAGNRIVAGTYGTSGSRADFNPRVGIGERNPLAGHYVLIASYDPFGALRWSQLFGSKFRFDQQGRTQVEAMVAGNGRIYAAGRFSGRGDFDNGIARIASFHGSADAFIIALNAETGEPDTGFGSNGVVLFGGNGDDFANALALSPDGVTLFVGGHFGSSRNVSVPLPGGGSFTPPSPDESFLMALDAQSGAAREFGVVPVFATDIRKTDLLPTKLEAIVASGPRVFILATVTLFDQDDVRILSLDAATGQSDTDYTRVSFGGLNGNARGRGLAISSDGLVLYATGMFAGSDFGVGGIGPIASIVDGYDQDDFDPFVLAVNAQTGVARRGFGLDLDDDGVGDGVTVLTDPRVNVVRAIAAQGDSSTGALFVLANSTDAIINGSPTTRGGADAHVVKLHAGSGLVDLTFGVNGDQLFGGGGTDIGYGLALTGDRVVVAGTFDSIDAGVGGFGNIFANFVSGLTSGSLLGGDGGFLLELNSTTGSAFNGGPRISSLDPAQVQGGGPDFFLTVHGDGFTPDSVVLWNDQARFTSFGDNATLVAAIPTSDIADSGGTTRVSVLQPDGDQLDLNDRISNEVPFDVVGTGTPPVITQLAPWSRPFLSDAFQLTVNGSGFEAGAAVRWNGERRRATFVSSTQLIGFISAEDLAETMLDGPVSITASNPGTEASNVLEFVNGNAVVERISPQSLPPGGPAFELTFFGYFAQDAIATWNGQPRPRTFASRSELRVMIPASDIASPGDAALRVENPGSGADANHRVFHIALSELTPFVDGLSPSSALPGSGGFMLTVFGNAFFNDCVVLWNGSPRTTTLAANPPRLLAQISASDVALAQDPGGANLSVRNGNAQTSNTVRFIVGAPSLAQIQPRSATPGGPEFTLTATGSRFAIDALIRWNGGPRTTAYISSTQLMATIPASDIAQAGTAIVDVDNGHIAFSNSLNFSITVPSGPTPRPNASAERHPARDLRVRDRDGDGWIDDLERILGSSPYSAASTPAGFRTPVRIALVAPLAPRLRTVRTGRGRLVLSGALPLPADYAPDAEPVYVFADGRVRAFELNALGASPRGRRESFRITLPRRNARESGGTAPFVLHLERSAAHGPVLLHLGETLYQLPETRPR